MAAWDRQGLSQPPQVCMVCPGTAKCRHADGKSSDHSNILGKLPAAHLCSHLPRKQLREQPAAAMHHAACDGSAAVHGCMGDPGATIAELKTSTPGSHGRPPLDTWARTHVRTHMGIHTPHAHAKHKHTHTHTCAHKYTHIWRLRHAPLEGKLDQHRTGAARGALTMQRVIPGHTDSCRHAQLAHAQLASGSTASSAAWAGDAVHSICCTQRGPDMRRPHQYITHPGAPTPTAAGATRACLHTTQTRRCLHAYPCWGHHETPRPLADAAPGWHTAAGALRAAPRVPKTDHQELHVYSNTRGPAANQCAASRKVDQGRWWYTRLPLRQRSGAGVRVAVPYRKPAVRYKAVCCTCC